MLIAIPRNPHLAGYICLQSGWARSALILLTIPIVLPKNAARIVVISTLGAQVDQVFLDGPVLSSVWWTVVFGRGRGSLRPGSGRITKYREAASISDSRPVVAGAAAGGVPHLEFMSEAARFGMSLVW
jgi:hypothetical protein